MSFLLVFYFNDSAVYNLLVKTKAILYLSTNESLSHYLKQQHIKRIFFF